MPGLRLKIFTNFFLFIGLWVLLIVSLQKQVVAIETDCVIQGDGRYLCSGRAFCNGAWTAPNSCQAICGAGSLNGAPYCNPAGSTPPCSYSCESSGTSSGSPKESPTWVRILTKNYDGNNYWAPESQASTIGPSMGPNKIDDKIIVRSDLNADPAQVARLGPWSVWSDRFCARGRVAQENESGDLNRVNFCGSSTYCLGEGRDSCTRAWCKRYSDSPAHSWDNGCDSPWFGPDNSGANGNNLGDGYHYLDEVDGMIEYMRSNSSIPSHFKFQNFSNRFTYNIVSRSEYNLLVDVTPPNSYFCYGAYYVENNRTGRTTGIKPVTKINGGESCYLTHTVESNGNLVIVEMKKAVKGRVVGINYSNRTHVGLGGRSVVLRVGNTLSGGALSALLTLTTTTDSNGYYAFRNDQVGNYAYYTVDVQGAPPTGYTGDGYAVRWNNLYLANGQNIAYSYKKAGTVGDVKVGDATYALQTTSAINDSHRDCSSGIPALNYPEGRCWFGYRLNQPVTNPSIQAPAACLVTSGNETLRWTPAVDSDPGQTITYALRVYNYPNTCTGANTQVLTGCPSALHSNNSIPNTVTSGYVNYSGYNFPSAGNYAIYVQATSSDGSKSNWVTRTYAANDKPTVSLSTPTNLNNGSVRLNWTHARATSFNVFQDGASEATGITATTYTIPQACDGVSHTYRVNAVNACGTTTGANVAYTCSTPKPTCGAVQYYNGSAWVNYTTQTFNPPGLARQFRSSASGGVAPLSYRWTSTCGTINTPTTTSMTYTSPTTPGASCQLRFTATSATGIASDNCSVAVTVNTQPSNNGTRSFTGLTLTKQSARSGSLNYNVSGYVNSSAGTATILTTAGSICDPSIGTCAFSTGGLTKSIPSNSGTTSHPITVTLKNNNYGIRSGGTFPINTTFRPGGATSALPVESGTVTVTDSLPVCTSITYSQNPTRAFPGTINMTFGVRDDWSLKGFGVGIFNPDGSLHKTSPAYSNTYFSLKSPITDAVDSRTVIAPWTETTTMPSGLYYTRAYLADWYGYHNPPYSATRYRWCTPYEGYDPYLLIDNDAPSCELVSFNPASPSNSSPVTITSIANDEHVGINRYRFLIYKSEVEKGVGTPIYDSGIISATSGAGVNLTRTAAWNTAGLEKGSYDVYVDWYDSLGNMTNTNENNACVGTYEIPTSFVARVLYPKEGEEFGYTHQEAAALDGNRSFEFDVKKNGRWVSPGGTWQDITGSCSPTYPDDVYNNDHDTEASRCNAYYRTSTSYSGLDDYANIRIKLPKVNNRSKYVNCYVSVYNDKISSTNPIDEAIGIIEPAFSEDTGGPTDYEYCRPHEDFLVVHGRGTAGTREVMYPTRVDFQLEYGTERILGRVFGPNSDYTALQFSPSYVTSLQSSDVFPTTTTFTDAYYVLPPTAHAEYYFPKSPSSDSKSYTNIAINSSPFSANKQCFYLFDTTNWTGNRVNGDISVMHSWFKDGLMTEGLLTGNTCSIRGLELPDYSVRLMSPTYQTKLFVMMAPQIRVAESSVRFVDDSLSCEDDGESPNSVPGVNSVRLTLSDGANSYSVNTTSGNFSIPNVLTYNQTYSLSISSIQNSAGTNLDLSNFGFCPEEKPLNFNTKTELPEYPLGENGGNIIRHIKIFKKDSNSWYQTYNGGVHSNQTLILRSNAGVGSSQGMPAAGVLVGNPTSSATIPNGVNMYSALGIAGSTTNSGGLVSSFNIQPGTFSYFGNNLMSWGAVNLGEQNKYLFFAQSIANQFDEVELMSQGSNQTWGRSESVSGAIVGNSVTGPTSQVYHKSSMGSPSTCLSNCSNTLNLNNNKVVFVDFEDDLSNPTLYVNQNLNASLSNGLILYVNGNVEIAPSVVELDGVMIIATGNITFPEQAPKNSDVPINIRGALYGLNVIFDRNLREDVSAYVDSPAVRVLFNPHQIVNSNNLPAEIMISNIYYEVQE